MLPEPITGLPAPTSGVAQPQPNWLRREKSVSFWRTSVSIPKNYAPYREDSGQQAPI